MQNESPAGWNRTLIGVLALVFIVTGALIGTYDTTANIWYGALLKSGFILAAFWIGTPRKGRVAAWGEHISPYWIVGIAVGLLVVVRAVRNIQILIPILFAFFVLVYLWPLLTGRRKI